MYVGAARKEYMMDQDLRFVINLFEKSDDLLQTFSRTVRGLSHPVKPTEMFEVADVPKEMKDRVARKLGGIKA